MPKTEYIEKMFDSIAPEYDLLNHLLSMDIDKRWRKVAVRHILSKEESGRPCHILDVACGTGDFSLAVAGHYPLARITGIDLSDGMLEKGRKKVISAGLENRISLKKGDCHHLDYPDNTFDGVCVAFGVRNFEFLKESIREMLRVLKPGGRLVILELSLPKNKFIRTAYKTYFSHILPVIGRSISRDRSAYRYLPESVIRFPMPDEFMKILKECGSERVFHRAFSLGICRLYTAVRK